MCCDLCIVMVNAECRYAECRYAECFGSLKSKLDLQFLIELDREVLKSGKKVLKSGKKVLKVEQFGKVSL
jgi:hypothetical protein